MPRPSLVPLGPKARSGLGRQRHPGTFRSPARHFVTATGQPFPWRGITAFRLLEYVARKKEADVRAYLAWAQSQDLTVVRVLAMGSGFMQLSPDEGRAALGRLLDAGAGVPDCTSRSSRWPTPASCRLASTHRSRRSARSPPRTRTRCVELANEPIHPTQAPDVGKADVLAALAARDT